MIDKISLGKKIKYWAIIVVVVILTYSFIGNLPLFEQETVIEIGIFSDSNWNIPNANSNIYAILDRAIEKFEQNHPKVKVHYESGIRKKDYSEYLARKAMRGELPDLFFVLDKDFYSYASKDIIEDIDYLINKDKYFRQEYFFRTALEAGKYQNKQYALPYEVVPKLMFVNKTLLEKEGFFVPNANWTWRDMAAIVKSVTKDTDGDGIIDQFGIYNYTWKEAAYANGVNLLDIYRSKTFFSNKNVIDSIKFAKLLYEQNSANEVTQKDFENGKVAFMPLSFSEYRMYKSYPYKIKKYSGFQWECTTMPAGPAGDNTSEIKTLLLGMNSKGKNKELSWELMKILTYDMEIQRDIFQYSQGASCLKYVTGSKYAESIIRRDMNVQEKVIDSQLLEKIISDGKITKIFPHYDSVMILIESKIKEIFENGKNIENTMKIIQRDIANFIK